MPTIETKRILLKACKPDLFNAIFKSEAYLAKYLKVDIAKKWTHFGFAPMRYSLKMILNNPADFIWWTYLIIHKSDQKLIGSCGFKGPPDKDGNVEIGYEIAPGYQGRGLATETAQALIGFAFSFPEVQSVSAQTLPEENASGRVLQKCGMKFIHILFDPEDGDIWLWRINRNKDLSLT